MRYFVLFLLIVGAGCSRSVESQDRAELETTGVERALQLVQEGQPKEAIESLSGMLTKDPELARVHLELGILLHESERDYVGAIYHYRRYLALRPKTEKRRMIEDRMRIARHLIAAGVVGNESVTVQRMAELEEENGRLTEQLKIVRQELAKERSLRHRELKSMTASEGDTNAAARGPALVHDGGIVKYTVQSGDSLSTIASKIYKDASKWEQIYEANRRELENSNALKIGQVLVIP